MITRVPGNLGDPAVSIEMPAGDPAYQLQVDPRARILGRRGRTRDATRKIAKRRKRSAAKGTSGSRSAYL